MSPSRYKKKLGHLLLLFVSVTEIVSSCDPICEEYYSLPPLSAIDSGHTQSLAIAHYQKYDSLLRLPNESNVSLFTSKEACAGNSPTTYCSLRNVTHNGGGNFSANLSCTDLQQMRGRNGMVVLEMKSLQVNESDCYIIVNVSAFYPVSNISSLRAEIIADNTCLVTLEGCFPPCCGSRGKITRVQFGKTRYWLDVVSCYEISFSISDGDAIAIHDNHLSPTLEVTRPPYIVLSIEERDINNLQNCYKSCSRTIDIGHNLMALGYTEGCFNVDITIMPPRELASSDLHLQSYMAESTYCELRDETSDLNIYIDCIGFNPKDNIIQESIILQNGVCVDDFIMVIGTPKIVPCMESRCQKVTSLDVEFCLRMCVDNIGVDNGIANLCERVATYALDGSLLTSQNVSAVLEVLGALANASSSQQIKESFNKIMADLLIQLKKIDNIYLISEQIGENMLTDLDLVLRKIDANNANAKVDIAPALLANLEGVVEIVSIGLREKTLTSCFVYTGKNAIVLARVEMIDNGEDYTFPKQGSETSGIKMKVPMETLCGRGDVQDTTNTECQGVVGSVITKHFSDYLNSRGDNLVSSLLLTTIIDSSMDYRKHIQQSPITIYFKPITPTSNYSNETCVFWDPVRRDWSSAGVYTSSATGPNGEITCVTTHLTSFSVLVDPESSEATAGQKALGIVSYIGCAISLACLLASLIIFFSFGKLLNKGVLLYIHINFVISLSLALTLFVIGIEAGTTYKWTCTVIAALLHYLFLCVFCWMLAEGIMLYMLVVRVFGSSAEKWCYLLLLGWGLPLPVVAVSLGIRHEEYGTKHYCWLSDSKGTYWAFLGPMITIIMINSVILVITVGSMIRSRRKFVGRKDSKNWNLALTAVKSTVILLPLLGLTWIIGPFSLLKNTDVLSWAFAILNSLQGFFFFLLHVLRNDKVHETMKKCVRCVPAIMMEKSFNLRDLSSNITLASAESVTSAGATAGATAGASQLDCEHAGSPQFNADIYQRPSSEASPISLCHPEVDS